MNNFQQQTLRPGFHPQGMMGGPGVGMAQHPRMMGNPQQQMPGMMGQQGMMGGPQHRMAGPGMHPQGMMGAQQHRMGMPGQQGMMGAQHPRMAGPVVSQQGMMGAQRPVVSQQGMMGAQRPVVSQQGMMGAQQQRMAGPVVSQQGMMGAQRPMVSQQGMMGAQRPMVSQQGMMGAQQQRMAGPVVSQQGMMGTQRPMVSQQGMMGAQRQQGMMGVQRPVVNQQGIMGAQHPRMTGPRVCQPGMMGNQQPGMMGNQQPGMMGNQQPGMMGNQQQRMPGVSQQSMMGPRVNQQLMMRGQQQRMMGHAVSQQSMMGMQQQRMMGVNQQRSVGPGQMQQGMMGAQQHGPNFPQQSMMGTTGAQQQRIMVTILPEHGAVGPAGSQRIVESTHSVSERQVIEINTSSDVSVMDRKQNGGTRSNNVNIVISPQEDMPRYDAPSSTASTSVSPRASTLRTLVEVPLSFDTEVSSEKQKYTKDVDHRLLKPDLDPGVLKDGDVDYRTLVPIRPAEDSDKTAPQTTPDKSSSTKDIPLKLLVKLKPLKPLQKAQPPGETVKTEPKTEPETSSPTEDDKEPSKPGLVPVPSKGSANKSKITLKLIDRTAKQKRTEQDSILSGIPNLLENSVQRLSLSMEPTQQEILSALEEDCGCLAPLSSAVDQNMTEGTPEVSDINKSINLKWPVSALSAEDRMETMLVEDVGSKVYSSQQREESGMSTSPEEVVISELPTTKSSETVADSGNLSQVSGEATELSERHNFEQKQEESENILEANRPFLNHSKGPLKSFSLQDKEERQARDDELIQASLDAMVEPSEVQNIAVSFRNPIAEAFEPNKPGSPLLSLALKLTRLHKRNVTKSYNGKHLRRTISMIEEGMEADRSRDTGVQQQKNKKELRLVICRVFARSGESQPELKECPAATRDASEKSQDTRTVIVSEEAIKKEDAMLPSCFHDTKRQGGFDCEDFTPLNNNLPGVTETQHSKNDNLVKSSTTSPKRKAFDDVDPPLPRKLARSNSPAVCSNTKLGTVHVKQEGETVPSLSNSTRNLFNTLSRSTNSHTDLQSRNSNNSNSHSAMTGEFSNLRLKLENLSSSIDVSTVDSTQKSQASVSRSSEGSEIKGQCNKCNKPIKANSKTDRTKSLVKEEELQCDIQGDCTFKTGPTKSNYNSCDLPCGMAQENSKKGSQEARSKNQAEDVGSTQVVPKVEENVSNQNLHSTCRQSNQRLFLPHTDSTGKMEHPGVSASHFAQKSQTLQSNSKSLHCHDQSYKAASEHTDINSAITESNGRYNSFKNASGTLQNENGVTLKFPKVPSPSQQTTKTVQNLPKESQSHQKACSSQSIPVILGREASESQTTKTSVSPGTSPHAKTFPSQQKDEQHKSPKAQGKFFRVCQPLCKLKEGSTAFKTLQEDSKNGVQGELVVKQEDLKMETSEEHEGTTSSDVRKVEFSKADANQEDPSKWPQGISLQAMKHVVLVDLDCWPQFFQSLPKGLVEDTFVWGFQDAKTSWMPPVSCEEYCRLGRKRHFYLHPPCASADSAICMVAGKLDSYLPRHLPFTILSGLQGFTQLQHRWNRCKRKANLVDPNTTDLHNLLHHIFYTQDNSRSTS